MTREGLNLIISHEGFSPDAYWDSHGKKWTIGYGTTIYPNGTPVRQGDRITQQQAASILQDTINKTVVPAINNMVTSRINQYQLDALTSFAYNCGTGNLKKSTLLQMVNANPSDPAIRDEFAKWNRAGGKVLNGLVKRRQAEANLYFIMQDLSNQFRQNYSSSQGLQQNANKQKQIQAARKDLSGQFQQMYKNSPIVSKYAENMRMRNNMNQNLSSDFRQNYGNSQGLLQNARKNNGNGQVFEDFVRKVVNEVFEEQIIRKIKK